MQSHLSNFHLQQTIRRRSCRLVGSDRWSFGWKINEKWYHRCEHRCKELPRIKSANTPSLYQKRARTFLHVLISKVLHMHTLQHDDLLLLGTVQLDLTAHHEEDQGDGQGVKDDFYGEQDGVVCDDGQWVGSRCLADGGMGGRWMYRWRDSPRSCSLVTMSRMNLSLHPPVRRPSPEQWLIRPPIFDGWELGLLIGCAFVSWFRSMSC